MGGGGQIESTQIAWNLGLVRAGKRKAQLRSLEAGPGWPPRAGPMKDFGAAGEHVATTASFAKFRLSSLSSASASWAWCAGWLMTL